jgi:hypothetical protein
MSFRQKLLPEIGACAGVHAARLIRFERSPSRTQIDGIPFFES